MSSPQSNGLFDLNSSGNSV